MSGLAVVMAMAAVQAQAQPNESLAMIEAALRCRDIVDAGERVRCYDQAMVALAAAASSGRIEIADRPRLVPAPVVSIIRSVREVGASNWLVELEEGGTWQTLANSGREPLPRPGQRARITRSPLGSFAITVPARQTLRVRRVR